MMISALSMGAIHAQASDSHILSGVAHVIDGDTIKIDNIRIRLHGIDAPEKKQYCAQFPCGEVATIFLTRLINGENVMCEGKKYDRYKRLIAICHWQHVNVNALMVSAGLSHAYLRYSKEFVEAQKLAEKTKQGMWNFDHMSPEEFRHARKK